ncbi:aminotransferase class I/II-fold pyridoxal phosphate-dependent enzyme [Methanomethylophilus alvi]|uniref:aminotransferase class I/II-fold pyridoxal phosphate-dependent enzyme n=1 Tax=Methanomethylophilus alvi TaxID=1291540 RepID=UPI0037DC1DAE
MSMKFKQAERLQKLPPYLFVRLEQLAAQKKAEGVKMIDFGIGDPDLPCPGEIVRAMKKAADVNENQKYSSSKGEKDLREAIAEYYKKRFNVKVNPDTEVCVTIGSKEGIYNIAQAFVNDGEKIIAPNPGYPVYSGAATLFNNAVCDKITLKKENEWLLDVKECPTDAKLMYINYPNNPTGATADLDYVKDVYKWAKRNKTILAYDNAYCEMTYDGYRAPSVLQAGKDAIEFMSFSKTFCMTGFRLGFAVGNEELVSGLTKCKGQIDSGAPIFIQKAAITALQMYTDDGYLKESVQKNMDEFGERRKVLVEGLNELGYECDMPKGTFYVWFDCGKTSMEFTQEMIDKGVIVTPGTGFGGEDGYIRMAVTKPVDQIQEALRRMGKRND